MRARKTKGKKRRKSCNKDDGKCEETDARIVGPRNKED
jgi:hypothetical protein